MSKKTEKIVYYFYIRTNYYYVAIFYSYVVTNYPIRGSSNIFHISSISRVIGKYKSYNGQNGLTNEVIRQHPLN